MDITITITTIIITTSSSINSKCNRWWCSIIEFSGTTLKAICISQKRSWINTKMKSTIMSSILITISTQKIDHVFILIAHMLNTFSQIIKSFRTYMVGSRMLVVSHMTLLKIQGSVPTFLDSVRILKEKGRFIKSDGWKMERK